MGDVTTEIANAPMNVLGIELLVAAILTTLCVALHGIGLTWIARFVNLSDQSERATRVLPVSPKGIMITIALVLGLFVLHFLEIWIFAVFYLWADALPTLESALYHSVISYSTVGYNDGGIEPRWRLVGAMESIVGIILLGWSTAYFVRLLGRIDAR